jgi:phenylacetate-coenzyme A ligase PaaK-like adenylate-forming protein
VAWLRDLRRLPGLRSASLRSAFQARLRPECAHWRSSVRDYDEATGGRGRYALVSVS